MADEQKLDDDLNELLAQCTDVREFVGKKPKKATTRPDDALDELVPDPSGDASEAILGDSGGDPGEVAAARASAVADVLEMLSDELQAYYASNSLTPSGKFQDGIAELFIQAATSPGTQWLPQHWPFLVTLLKFARDVDGRGPLWRGGVWAPIVWQRLQDCCEYIDVLRNPPDPPKPKRVALESFAELQSQKLSPRQIAKIYGWFDESGQADLEKYKLAAAGELETPKFAEFEPPETDMPKRQPNMEIIDILAERMIQEEQEAIQAR